MKSEGVTRGFNRQRDVTENDLGRKLTDVGADLPSRLVVLDRAWTCRRMRQCEQAYV